MYMQPEKRILCVDDEKNVLRAIERIFMEDDVEVLTAGSADEGIEQLKSGQPIQVVISDYRMPGRNGVDFLGEVYKNWPETVRVVLSGYADAAAVVAAINEGHIYKFIPKPWNDDELKVAINNALEIYFLREKNVLLTKELEARNAELETANVSLKKALTENTNIHNKFQTLMDLIPVSLIGIDPDDSIVFVNKDFREKFKDLDMLIGLDRHACLPQDINALIEKTIAAQEAVSGVASIRGKKERFKGASVDEKGQRGVIMTFCEVQDE